MDNEQLVQWVTAEVMRRLALKEPSGQEKIAACRKRALVIFTGGTIGFEASLLELRKIQAADVELTVVLSAAAEKILAGDRIKEQLGGGITLITPSSPYPGRLLRESDLVLVPVLTQNTAAKLAGTLSDSLPATLILQGLMLGKPVVAAMNAADPQDAWRIKMNMGQSSPGLVEALRQNLKKIAGYGVKLVPVHELAAASQKILAATGDAAAHPSGRGDSLPRKNLVNAETVKAAAQAGLKEIVIAANSIVTPLARDLAREYAIALVAKNN